MCRWVFLVLIENGQKKNTCAGSLDSGSQSFSALGRNETDTQKEKGYFFSAIYL